MGNFKNELLNFQSIPRELVFDKLLSDRARFVYVFMACKPDGWDFYLEPMAKEIGYSVDTLRKYIGELVASGWLVKGIQSNENGIFGAVEYTLRATNFSDTENFRHGKNSTLYNKDYKENIDCNKDNNIKDKVIKDNKNKNNAEKPKKDEIFEKCWVEYRRKGSKKKAKEYWIKLSDMEKQTILPHIKAYVSTRELIYQKDFERYLRDKVFTTIVFSKNMVVFDPTKNTTPNKYVPQESSSLFWNEYYKCYMYIGFWNGDISDGYTDDDRPNGAKVTLNNGRGVVVWNSENKKWEKE